MVTTWAVLGDHGRSPHGVCELLTSTAFFLGVLVTPAVAYLIRRHILRPDSEPLVFILACIVAYAVLLASIPIRRAEIEMAASSYDMADTSPAAEAARRRISDDTGITLAPFTGLVIVPTWCLINYAFLGSIHWCGAAIARVTKTGEP